MNKVLKFVGLVLLLLPMVLMGSRYSVATKILNGDMTLLVNGAAFTAYDAAIEVDIQRYNKSYLVVMTNVATGSANDTLFISNTPYIGSVTGDLMALQAMVTDTVSLAADGVTIVTLPLTDQASVYDIDVGTAAETTFTTDSLQLDIYIIRLERFRK